MSNYTIDAHSFETYYYTALLSKFGTCILLVLFVNTTYLLHTRIRTSRGWFVAAKCTMGLFAALHLALQITMTVLTWRVFYLGVQGDATRAFGALTRGAIVDYVADYLLIANNLVADSIFIYRCYVIWGRNLKVVIIPAISLVASTVIGSVGAPKRDAEVGLDHDDYRLAFGMIILTNLTLMALTAGRIWWIRRDVVTVLEPSVMRTYDTVIAIIIILYLIAAVRLNKQDSLPAISVFRAAIPQILNIAPILIIVRVGSGLSVYDETREHSSQSIGTYTHSRGLAPSVSIVIHGARRPDEFGTSSGSL
ncbi:hypothetical protein C8J57DRAFT_1376647 [Mycena rebaudengoi]|nr:hypothetical protein C8J57DRAFT_1376647 [Mycena rebaudengoi]